MTVLQLLLVTLVTLIVEGNTTLGDADTDSTTVKGPAVFEETSRFNVGISLGATTMVQLGKY